ncbi:hypothetical protein VTI74DRAFT_5041 [Chaetomium olivicolor]
MLSLIMAAMVVMLGLVVGAGGHMVMNKPPPYNLNVKPLLQVNPLSGDAFPFPCHNQYGFTERTLVEAGGATLVNFTGSGQHGGGSCQFSITYDEPVNGGHWNKSAKFKTIYSIIGGCPAVFTDESRNLPAVSMDENQRMESKHCSNDTGIDCIRQFMVPIPKFLKNGPATFAWTWFNKLGNKEMYMNCAPINITGGTGDEKEMEDLPDIFVANYPNDPEVPNCITGTRADKVVVNFPNPGKYGRILQYPVGPSTKPSGYCSLIPPALSLPNFETERETPTSTGNNIYPTHSTLMTPPGCDPPVEDSTARTEPAGTNPSLPTITDISAEKTTTPSPVMANTTITTTIPTARTQTVTHFINTTTSSTWRTAPPSMVLPTDLTRVSLITTMTISHTVPLGPGPVVVSKPKSKAVACPTHGVPVCLDDNMFGMCNWGWATPQELAAGTECKDGRIARKVKLDVEGRDGDYVYSPKYGKMKIVHEDENGLVWVAV